MLFFALLNHMDFDHYMIAGGLFLYVVLVGAPMLLIFELDLAATFLIVSIYYGCRILAVYTFFGPRGVCSLKVNDHLDQTAVLVTSIRRACCAGHLCTNAVRIKPQRHIASHERNVLQGSAGTTGLTLSKRFKSVVSP